jgi:hypothetical protein
LTVMQIDHTPVDAIVVDSLTRRAISFERLNLTRGHREHRPRVATTRPGHLGEEGARWR